MKSFSINNGRLGLGNAAAYADINADLTRLTFRKLIPTTIIATIGMVVTTAILARYYQDHWLWLLTTVMLLPCSGRVVVATAFSARRDDPLSLEDANRWQVAYSVLTFLYCCTMAASTLHNFRYHPPGAPLVCILGSFSIATGLSSRPGLRPGVLQVCGLILFAPLGYSVLRIPHPMSKLGLILILFFFFQFCEAVQNQFSNAVEQLRTRRKLRTLSEQDALTGLANRRYFQDHLVTLCHTSQSFAVLFIDLDRFKEVNDRHGHAIGDLVLKTVAGRLEAIIRHSDLLARLGGDEFAILQTPVINAYTAQALATRINRDLAAPFYVEGHLIEIGASVGIKLSNHPDIDPNILLNNADKALYQVKQAGGGSFCLAEA